MAKVSRQEKRRKEREEAKRQVYDGEEDDIDVVITMVMEAVAHTADRIFGRGWESHPFLIALFDRMVEEELGNLVMSQFEDSELTEIQNEVQSMDIQEIQGEYEEHNGYESELSELDEFEGRVAYLTLYDDDNSQDDQYDDETGSEYHYFSD